MTTGRIKAYDGFDGVDLSNGGVTTAVGHSPRLFNVYKDYNESKGRVIETIPGFRKRFCVENGTPTDFFFYKKVVGGVEKPLPIVHVGDKLYLWSNFPESIGVIQKEEFTATADGKVIFSQEISEVKEVLCDKIAVDFSYDKLQKTISLPSSCNGKAVEVRSIRRSITDGDILLSGVSEKPLTYFVYGGRLYILGGGKYYVFDGESASEVTPYIPTTYIGITQSSIGEKLDEKNVLTKLFYNTFATDGTAKEFYLSENNLEEVVSVEVYGETVTSGFTVDLGMGKITFSTPPQSGIDAGFEDGYAGIRVLAKSGTESKITMLLNAKHAKVFEGSVILAGFEDFGGIYYSAVDAPEYFPELNFSYIGGGIGRINGLSVCGNELFAYYSSSDGGGIYRITSLETGVNSSPIVYSSELVSSSEKLIYCGTDFLDLPTFLTSNGLYALASPNLKLERVVEKRSGLIDYDICGKDLKNAKLFAFDGYICLCLGGNIYMGDSRNLYRNERGESEFEWFIIKDVATYKNAYTRYAFSERIDGVDGKYFLLEEVGKTANGEKEDGTPQNAVSKKSINGKPHDVVTIKSKTPVFSGSGVTFVETANEYVVKECEDYIGGVKEGISDIKSFDGNVYFTTASGLYSFNFDKKREGKSDIYDFDGRTVPCEIATPLDDLGFSDMKKKSLPKSLVIKLKCDGKTQIKVKSRTESGKERTIGKINATRFNFDDVDFSSLSFNTLGHRSFVLRDDTASFLEKQIIISTDGYQSAIKLYGLSYRYKVVNKLKNKKE